MQDYNHYNSTFRSLQSEFPKNKQTKKAKNKKKQQKINNSGAQDKEIPFMFVLFLFFPPAVVKIYRCILDFLVATPWLTCVLKSLLSILKLLY